MNEAKAAAGVRLNQFLIEAGLAALDAKATQQMEGFLSLFIRWNTRMNLTSVRDGDAILRRHFVESIACAQALPANIATLLDFGSGGGFPGIPIAICRPGIAVTLAESQGKKSAFLREAVRMAGLPAQVHAGRAEALQTVFDCVVLRAVDRMEAAVRLAVALVARQGWLVLMTTGADLPRLIAAAGEGFRWREGVPLPGSEDRLLALGERSPGPS
jgi:16S rRNA (guanine527-N7)-methyltransferase